MALNECCRYSWVIAFLLIFLGFDVGYSSSDRYYYKHDQTISQHIIVRRSAFGSPPQTDDTEVTIINGTSTPVPPVGETSTSTTSPPKTGGSYVTSNKTGAQKNTSMHQDANRTSPPVPSNVTANVSSVITPNGGPVVQQLNISATIVNTTVMPDVSSTGIIMVSDTIENTAERNDSDDLNITINQFSHPFDNETLLEHNITQYQKDSHQYYNSSFVTNNEVGHHFWVNMTNRHDVQVNDMLSQSHRRAATVKLSFDFPFYGHIVRNVTIATGGFLYTGEYVHSWLAATQYIAPLMANFDTSLSKHSYVKYVDNGTAFTVLWEKVQLQDKPDSGDFTFQATLHKNGDIVFVYQNVPVVIENIQDDQHPVKVGLSDAYIIDRTIFFVRRKTIYEYHRVNFNRQDIKNWTVIVLNALPTCVDLKDCESCLSTPTSFSCTWCPGANRCSTGTDRNRQNWLLQGCDKSSLNIVAQCPMNSSYTPHVSTDGEANNIVEGETTSAAQTSHIHTGEHIVMHGDHNVSMGISGIIGILFIIALVAGLGVWALYAYRNPHTASGQFLIRYRPSQWSWKRGEARYTAATIHM